MVFQDYALFPHLSVAENVAFGLRERKHPAGKIEERVKQMLELVRLSGFDQRLPGELSGGQKQRVALARAVAFPPRLLLMDEPLGALDLKLREAMQMELKRVQKQLRITTVYVTHDQQEAMSMSDRIALMNGGRIVQIGTAREMYEQPATKFAARFIGNINFLPVSDITPRTGGFQAMSLGCPVLLEGAHPAASTDRVLALRPEHLRLQSAGADHASNNFLPGRVISVRFFGNLSHVDVALAPGETIVVETHPGDPQAVEGLDVDVCWPPEKGQLLAD
jgi:ABC-type Fe3+/spermidine/putrescine transport system ATPase subunit